MKTLKSLTLSMNKLKKSLKQVFRRITQFFFCHQTNHRCKFKSNISHDISCTQPTKYQIQNLRQAFPIISVALKQPNIRYRIYVKHFQLYQLHSNNQISDTESTSSISNDISCTQPNKQQIQNPRRAFPILSVALYQSHNRYRIHIKHFQFSIQGVQFHIFPIEMLIEAWNWIPCNENWTYCMSISIGKMWNWIPCMENQLYEYLDM